MRSVKIILLIACVMGIVSFLIGKLSAFEGPPKVSGTIYDLRATALDGQEIDFSIYKGKTLLIVNTASKCGYTYQYEELQKLHELYGDRVTILGFPANNFLWQEPGSNEDIASFCQKNYGVTFQMFEKISVKGKDAHPVYQWLHAKSGKSPSWNFCKYIVDANGNIKGFFGPKVKPLDDEIVKLIR